VDQGREGTSLVAFPMLFFSLLLLLFFQKIENEPLFMTKLNTTCITVFGYRGFELCDENYRDLGLGI
jgi:hypothetical protein